MRRERGWRRLSAVLLSLTLAFGAVVYRIADTGRPDPAGAHPAPSAVMASNVAATATAEGERPRQARLVANRGYGAALLFVVALATLLAGLRRPPLWSLMALLERSLPAGVVAPRSRGRAPPLHCA